MGLRPGAKVGALQNRRFGVDMEKLEPEERLKLKKLCAAFGTERVAREMKTSIPVLDELVSEFGRVRRDAISRVREGLSRMKIPSEIEGR